MTRTSAEDTTSKTGRKSGKRRRKSEEQRPQIGRKPGKIDPETDRKSTSERSWAIWGDQGRLRDGDGRAQDRLRMSRDAPGTAQERSWQRPGAPRRVPKRVRTAPGTLLWRAEAATEHVRSVGPWRERSEADF